MTSDQLVLQEGWTERGNHPWPVVRAAPMRAFLAFALCSHKSSRGPLTSPLIAFASWV